MCEEELPRDLNNLEIGPITPQIKLCDSQLPISLNPFYNETQAASGQIETVNIFGDVKCSCRVRRRSESVLADCKPSNNNPNISRFDHSIKNPTQFKRKNRKKILLKEPILNSLQKCLHPKHLKAFGDIPNRLFKKSTSNNHIGEYCKQSFLTIGALNLDDSIGSLKINGETQPTSSIRASEITDFRDLIEQCQSLLETNVCFGSWNSSIMPKKHLKHFSMIQSVENRPQRTRHNENHKILGDKERTQCGDSNAGTSCSQQARINASRVAAKNLSSVPGSTPPCDVTIDELASYFETFVHIPKKMSSMAEMMYI